jgi:hypothetical protein
MTHAGPSWWRRVWPSRAPVLVLAAIILVGVVERLYRFTAPILDQHFFRQTQTASQVWLWDRFGFSLFDYHVPMFGGGYWVLEYPWYQEVVYALSLVFGFHEELGRVVSIAAFVASAYLLYEIGRRLLGSRAAAIASVAFLTFMPITVFYYRAFLIDPFIITFALLMVLAALRLSERITWPWLSIFLGAAFVTALGKTNLIAVFALPVLTLLYRAFVMKRAARAQWAALVGGAVVILVAVIAWTRHADAINLASNGMTYGNMRWWYFGSTVFDVNLWTTVGQRFTDMLGPIGLLSVGLGLAAIPRLRTGYRIEMAGLVVGGIASIAVFANLNRVHDYYQLPYYPTIALLGGLGVWSLAAAIGRGGRGVSFQIAGGLLLTMIAWWTYVLFAGSYFAPAGLGGLPNRDQGLELAANTPDKPVVIIGENFDYNDPTLLYEARRVGWRVNSLDTARARSVVQEAKNLGAIAVYKGPSGMPAWVPEAARAKGLVPTFETPSLTIYTQRGGS